MDNIAPPSRVVVGVDGSPQSRQALQWASRMAESIGSTLDVVAAWDFPASYGLMAGPIDWDPEADMRRVATETIASVFDARQPPGMQLSVQRGGAAKVLLRQSKGALMLVVGSRGHGGFAGLLLGSVSAAVAEHATCPVLVVHGEAIPGEMVR